MSAFNGSGTFVITGVGLPYVTATTISSTVANQLNTDLATGLSTAITKDGQTTPTANIPMGGFKITGAGAANSAGDVLSWGAAAGANGLVGTATNDDAVAGRIGEFVETSISSVVPVALVTATAKDIATISLTAGDWDVEGSFITIVQAGTVTTSIQAGLSNGVANSLPALDRQQINGVVNTAGNNAAAALPRQRFSLSATTTIRMVASVVFSAAALSGAGFLNARRVR